MSSQKSPLFFYQYLGAHSLLIGLLPFFLPVYLWSHGLGPAGLCLLIGVSGLTFSLSLRLWQIIASRWPLHRLVSLTFALELLLVFIVGLLTTVPGSALFLQPDQPIYSASTGLVAAATVIGIANGLYNAFFWTTQRTLFLQQLGDNDTGKQYGNFQIFVTLFLKAGILIGGFLLDHGGFLLLLAISAGFSFVCAQWLARSQISQLVLSNNTRSVSLVKSLRFSDNQGSRPAFAIDGIFLYLESHFWTLSLFLLVQEDFNRLGIAVVILALGFALLFLLIKNRIDQLALDRVFRVAVGLYAASWLLRFTLNQDTDGSALLITLLVITFFSSFFRLAFNKRFFDVARTTTSLDYLLIKSYSSQAILGLFYVGLSVLLFLQPVATDRLLQSVYLFAALLSLIYLYYRDHQRTT